MIQSPKASVFRADFGSHYGRAVGNKHRNPAVRGREALFPAAEPKARMEAPVADLLPADVPTYCEHVPPTTFDDCRVKQAHSDHVHDGNGHTHGVTQPDIS